MLKCIKACINNLKVQSTTLLSNRNDLFIQQSRSTFILKRRYPVPLLKKTSRRPTFKHKHFIYDLVEDTNIKKHPQIDLILLESIRGVGEKGDKVTVSSLKAYHNFLLPKLAVYATPENIQKYYIEDEEEKRKFRAFSSRFVERTINLLSQYYLSITMSMDVPWTIETWHISVSFRKAGFVVPKSCITLPLKAISGPDLSIENKEFYVIVKINNCEEVKVRCKIHHYTSNSTKQINYEVPFWKLPSVAIFPEDQPVLNSLPKHRLLTEINSTNE